MARSTREPDVVALRRLIKRMRELTPEQWERLRAALEPQRGPAFRAIWERSRRRAVVTQTIVPRSRTLAQVFCAAAELVAEFHPPRATRADVDRARENALASLPPGSTRDCLVADLELRAAVAQHVAGDELLEEVITSAGHAVAYNDFLSPEDFRHGYGVLEAVLPASAVTDSRHSG